MGRFLIKEFCRLPAQVLQSLLFNLFFSLLQTIMFNWAYSCPCWHSHRKKDNFKMVIKSERNLFLKADATNPVQATKSRRHLARLSSFTLPRSPPAIINPNLNSIVLGMSSFCSLSPVASQDCLLLIYWLAHLSAEPVNKFKNKFRIFALNVSCNLVQNVSL